MALPRLSRRPNWLRAIGSLRADWQFLHRNRLVRRRELFWVLLLSSLVVAAETGGAAMLLPIFTYIENGGNLEDLSSSSRIAQVVTEIYTYLGLPIDLITMSLCAFFLVIVRQGINYYNSIALEGLKWTVGRRTAVRYFNAIFNSTIAHVRQLNTGVFMTAADFECQACGAILRIIGTFWMQILTLISLLAILILTSPVTSALALLVIVLAIVSLGFLIRRSHELSKVTLAQRRTYTNFLAERFRALRLIKLSNTVSIEVRNADEIQKDIVRNQYSLLRTTGALSLIFTPAIAGFLLATLCLAVEVLKTDVSTIMLFGVILLRIMPVGQAIQKNINMTAQFAPSVDHIRESLRDASQAREQLDEGAAFTGVSREIRIENVSFTYPGNEEITLSNISVVIPAHRMTAIVGHSGAGKSTLVDLLPRLIRPNDGRILMDGVSLDQFSLRSLRDSIAYVPQDPFLFDATVADNIRYCRPTAAMHEVEDAARRAFADEFIGELEDGYETRLGDLGMRLSGGQRQRIVLARALLARTPMLILDEPTSALDQASEKAVQAAITELIERSGTTVIVIAHRLSTIANADFVIQLDHGRVIRTGTAAVLDLAIPGPTGPSNSSLVLDSQGVST